MKKVGNLQMRLLNAHSELLNGAGISACEEKTGSLFELLTREEIASSLFVNCVTLYTESEEKLEAVRQIYPENSKVKGIYVQVRNVGIIRAQ